MNELQKSLSKCRIEGNTLFLPPIEDGMLPNYKDVRTALLNAGATYKRNTFVFPSSAQSYIDRLMGGERVNIKKEFQFFATPKSLAEKLVDYADIFITASILEPSAGQGAIIEAIIEAHPRMSIHFCELMDENRKVLEQKFPSSEVTLHDCGKDFLQIDKKHEFARIIANPPFSKNQDIDHIRKMYEVLKPGGRIVTIASNHWKHSRNKKEVKFVEWLDEIGANYDEEIPAKTFQESGTTVSACIIIIDK